MNWEKQGWENVKVYEFFEKGALRLLAEEAWKVNAREIRVDDAETEVC